MASKAKGKGKGVTPPAATTTSSSLATRSAATTPRAIQYFADPPSVAPGPNGGLQRVGFDHASFEKAYQDLFGGANNEAEASAKDEGENGSAVAEETKQVESGEPTEAEKLIVSELGLSSIAAKEALAAAQGDLTKALVALTAPPSYLRPTVVA